MSNSNPGSEPVYTGVERRLFHRLRPRCVGGVRPAAKVMAPYARVTLLNISHGGICFTTRTQWNAGDLIVIELQQIAGQSKPLPYEAMVVWTSLDTNTSLWRIGCSWTTRLPYSDLQRFSG
jgi:hypothetical protein